MFFHSFTLPFQIFCMFILVGLVSAQIDVFNMGEEGYYCIKIPDLLVTFNGTLLAFGEGRRESCGDYTWTDLVYKRSFDNGQTWTKLEVLFSNSTKNNTNVIGNAAPVQIQSTGRILVPFCRNNEEVWLIFSDDDGATWSTPTPISGVVKPDWHWVGTGPPGSIQLKSGRIITPSYHSLAPHDTDGDISKSHIMYSDDEGATWQLGGMFSEIFLTSECQAIEFDNGTILINSRATLPYRIQAVSYDQGETIENIQIMPKPLIEPLGGCEGSTIRHPLNNWLFFSIPNNSSALRYNVSVFISKDEANSWELLTVVNPGRSAYSSLAVLSDNSVGLLYERSNLSGFIFVPQHISFITVWSPE